MDDDAQPVVSAPAVPPMVVGRAMYERDSAAKAMGIVLVDMAAGSASMSMAVTEDMVNGHGICHGGMIFTLADTAFAYACNSGNNVAVAAGAAIDFLAPARLGERLVAEATEHWTGGRSGITDVIVTGAGLRRIAVFRGRSTRIGGFVVEP